MLGPYKSGFVLNESNIHATNAQRARALLKNGIGSDDKRNALRTMRVCAHYEKKWPFKRFPAFLKIQEKVTKCSHTFQDLDVSIRVVFPSIKTLSNLVTKALQHFCFEMLATKRQPIDHLQWLRYRKGAS